MIDCNPLFLELEVLTLLPRYPEYNLLRDLAVDLGTDGQHPIAEAIKRLRGEHGIGVHVFNAPQGKEGRAASIARASWARAQEMAEIYIKTGR